MKLSTKKAITLLSLFGIILLVFVQASSVQAVTSTIAKDKALAFLQDVIQLDMTKYNITLISDNMLQPLTQSSVPEEDIDYNLSANGVVLDFGCVFKNNALTYARMDNIGSSSNFQTNISTNISQSTIAALEGYQTYTGENLQDMTNALANVDATQNITKISGDIKLTVQSIPLETDISLTYTINGTDYTGLGFAFRNGQFFAFKDDRNQWTIGNTDVNINKTQAINIAQQYMKTYSYNLYNGVLVNQFNISNINAELNTYPRDNTTTIYPYWNVQVNLNDSFPPNIYAISIGIWADSGTVFNAQPLGVGGGLPPSTSTSAPSQLTQSQKQTGISTLDISIVAGVVAAIAIIGVIAVKKRNK
jgi:hypothetical protein